MKRRWLKLFLICSVWGQPSAEKEELVLHFGYGSNMSESYMRQYTPSLKYVMNAQLPNFEIQFRKYSNNMGGGISSIIETVSYTHLRAHET